MRNLFHAVVRWGLGLHGAFHLVEFVLNLMEGAWLSAIFTLLIAVLMFSGALIDYDHHREHSEDDK